MVELSSEVAAVRSNLLTALADTLTPPVSPTRASTPSPPSPPQIDSPTPRASPPPPAAAEVAESEPASSQLVASSESPVTVTVPEISLTPPLREESPSGEETEQDISVIEHEETEETEETEEQEEQEEPEEVFVAEMSPSPAPAASQPEASRSEPLPETRSEAVSLLISHLTSHKWKEVWRLWRGCRELWDSVYSLGCGEGSLQWSQAQQDTEDLTHILNIYCRHLADTRDGE